MWTQIFIDQCSDTSCNNSFHFFPWTVVSLLPNKSARVLLAASDVKQQSKERQGSLSDADLVANGSHSWEWPPMSLCGFDKDRDLCSSSVYGSGPLWSLPTRTCRHLCLDEMGGRRMLLMAPFPLCPRLLLYQTHQGWTPTECSLLIEHLAWQGNHATVSPSLEEHFSVFIRLENGKMKPRLHGSHVFSREKGGDWSPVLGGNIIRGKYYY